MPDPMFITDPAVLREILSLPEPADAGATNSLSLRIPRELALRLEKGNPEDPVLLQFWPKREELQAVDGFSADPLNELPSMSPEQRKGIPDGVLWKYAGRVLVVTGGICAAHCRFCFRRHFPRTTTPPNWEAISSFLERNRSVEEIILSGGDPLGMTANELQSAFNYIGGLSFVKRVRIHTRYPVLFPSCLTPEIQRLFKQISQKEKQIIFVLHINHPAELSSVAAKTIRWLSRQGFSLFSQTVLLHGVNDKAHVLADLFTQEFRLGVVPYYLHQLDRVAGAAHFEVSVEEGRAIIKELQKSLPGYLVPRYVCEVPGAASKIPLF